MEPFFAFERMELIARIADVIVPVFLIVAIGWAYGRRQRPDLTVFNRIALDVLAPVLVYSALAARDFRIGDHLHLLIGATVLILGSGLLAWPVARLFGAQPRTLVGSEDRVPLRQPAGLHRLDPVACLQHGGEARLQHHAECMVDLFGAGMPGTVFIGHRSGCIRQKFDGKPGQPVTEADALIAYLQMLGTLVDFAKYDESGPNLR